MNFLLFQPMPPGAATAAPLSISAIALLVALSLATIATASLGTARLIEGMRSAQVSTLWEANKLYLIAVFLGIALWIALRIVGIELPN